MLHQSTGNEVIFQAHGNPRYKIRIVDTPMWEFYVNGTPLSDADDDTTFRELAHSLHHLQSAVDRVRRLEGCFAIIAKSKQDGSVYLISDRLGTLPIYHAKLESGWICAFSLEDIAPRLASRTLDVDTLKELLLHAWTMADTTLIREVKQVTAAAITRLESANSQTEYYDELIFKSGSDRGDLPAYLARTDAALSEHFGRLKQRFKRVGIMLSGGVDSSLLLAFAKEAGFESVLAVSARYQGDSNPELGRAIEVARILGVPHAIVDIADQGLAQQVEDFVSLFERPPSYFNICARDKMFEYLAGRVDVVLSGEGADVMFSDDSAYVAINYERRQKFVSFLPKSSRKLTANVLEKVIRSSKARSIAYTLRNNTRAFINNSEDFFQLLETQRLSPESLLPCLKGVRRKQYFLKEPTETSLIGYCQSFCFRTSNRNQFYFYNLLGFKYQIEVDYPFISRPIREIGLSLPDCLKSDANGPKPILKQLALRHITPEIIYASKIGFHAPGQDWLNGPLAKLRTLLSDRTTKERGLIKQDALDQINFDHDGRLWWLSLSTELFLRKFGVALEEPQHQ